jgi:hypothetical protein
MTTLLPTDFSDFCFHRKRKPNVLKDLDPGNEYSDLFGISTVANVIKLFMVVCFDFS